jgi:parallel beta-helix repeat protein
MLRLIMKTWLIAALAMSIGSAVVAPGAQGRTWRVNAAGTGDAPTIAAALDSCAAGDSVLVAAGDYHIDSHLIIQDDRVTLVSEAGAQATVLERGAASVGMLVGTESVVDGFTFNSIVIGNGGSFSHDERISNNVLRGSGDPYESAMIFWMHYRMMISGNCVYSYGSGIALLESSEFIFDNNTITACGTALALDGGNPWNTIRNNLIVGNDYGINLSGGVVGEVSCNNVFGNSMANYLQGTDPTGTNGNISVDPEFCAVDPPGSGNFFLQSDSPCAPGNHPDGASCGLIGASPVGCDETSVERASWGAIKSIYRDSNH